MGIGIREAVVQSGFLTHVNLFVGTTISSCWSIAAMTRRVGGWRLLWRFFGVPVPSSATHACERKLDPCWRSSSRSFKWWPSKFWRFAGRGPCAPSSTCDGRRSRNVADIITIDTKTATTEQKIRSAGFFLYRLRNSNQRRTKNMCKNMPNQQVLPNLTKSPLFPSFCSC